MAKTSAHFDKYISDLYGISDDPFSVLAERAEIRKDSHPAMFLTDNQDSVLRSRRATPARRGAGILNARADEGRQSEGGGGATKVRELELELELTKLKQATGKEDAHAQVGDDDAEEEW